MKFQKQYIALLLLEKNEWYSKASKMMIQNRDFLFLYIKGHIFSFGDYSQSKKQFTKNLTW